MEKKERELRRNKGKETGSPPKDLITTLRQLYAHAPERDVFGRRDATPNEVSRTLQGR